jgi:hypothetical protein
VYVPSPKQAAQLQALLEADGLTRPTQPTTTLTLVPAKAKTQPSPRPMPKATVALLVDSPNAYKSAKIFGESARPDYPAIKALAAIYGQVVCSKIFVNPGYRSSGSCTAHAGFKLVKGTDHDVDFLVVTNAMHAVVSGIATLVVVSGDHRFRDTQEVCKRLGIQYVTIGVPCCTNRELMAGGKFHRMPIIHPGLQTAA